jgi:hypothetical protein
MSYVFAFTTHPQLGQHSPSLVICTSPLEQETKAQAMGVQNTPSCEHVQDLQGSSFGIGSPMSYAVPFTTHPHLEQHSPSLVIGTRPLKQENTGQAMEMHCTDPWPARDILQEL